MGKTISDRVKRVVRTTVATGMIGLAGVGGYGCKLDKPTSKEIAIQTLENYLNLNKTELKEFSQKGALESLLAPKLPQYTILNDTTFCIDFEGVKEKYPLRIKSHTKGNSPNTKIYEFILDEFPSYVRIEVWGDSAKVTRFRQ